MVNQAAMQMTVQRTAAGKNSLGVGKNERNKRDSSGFREVDVI
jgi:hypothetical protein